MQPFKRSDWDAGLEETTFPWAERPLLEIQLEITTQNIVKFYDVNSNFLPNKNILTSLS